MNDPALIDAEELATSIPLDELLESAEDYFGRLDRWDPLLAKPFGQPAEAAVLLTQLGALLSVARLEQGMDVLDFGAGPGWVSRSLSQLGLAVVVADVSATALDIARELYRRTPPFGDTPPPRFLHFDGRHLDLPDDSVDRIVCFDAFHHVPNREIVLSEWARVLRPGGRAMLAEPGPTHSASPQSQAEMRSFRVVERDVDEQVIAAEAATAGFVDCQTGMYLGVPTLVPAGEFADQLASGEAASAAVRDFHAGHRLLLLMAPGSEALTSRGRDGLHASLEVVFHDDQRGTLTAVNTGGARWIGGSDRPGVVNVGVHLSRGGELVDYDFARIALSADEAGIEPGGRVDVDFELPPPEGSEQLSFDLVAEGVSWFAPLGACAEVVVERG
jgi:SAM-dependent methyltransferase